MPTVNWKGKSVEALDVRFKNIKEEWNEYQLEDGSILRTKSVVSEILRIPEEYDREGNPVYMVKSANMIVTRSPDDLKKKT